MCPTRKLPTRLTLSATPAGAATDVVLVSITESGLPLRRHPVSIDAGCVRVSALQPGRYRLDIHPTRRSLQILVVPPPHARAPQAPPDVIVGPHTVRKCGDGMLPLSLLEPLHVQQFTCNDTNGILVRIVSSAPLVFMHKLGVHAYAHAPTLPGVHGDADRD